ncbi:hypothetical protein Tco_0713680 [Tanacetum coccineum]
MDDPNITMEEYIRLEEEKAQRHGRTFNWQTATYDKMEYYEGEDDSLTNFEIEYPAIVFYDTSDAALSCEPTVSPFNENEIDFRISFDESNDEDYMVIFDENSFSCKMIFVDNLKMDSENENDKVNMPSFPSPKPTISHSDDLDFFKYFKDEFPAITYNDDLTSKLTEPSVNIEPLPSRDQRHPWLRYQVEGYAEEIVHNYEQTLETIWGRSVNRVHILDFVGLTEGMRQTLRDRLRMVYTGDEGQGLFTSHALRRLFEIRALLVREFILEFLSTCRMSDTEMGLDVANTLCFQLGGARQISSDRDFLRPTPSYVFIQGPVRRLCHRMIACIISGKGQTHEKYMFRHAKGRKSGARLSEGHFIGCLAAHFGLVSDQGLRGLSVVTRELPLLDLHKLGKLNIYERIGDTWAWVAPRPERQSDATAGAPRAAEDAPVVDEGAQADPAPMQAPQPPPPALRTIQQRISRLEDEVQELQRSVVGLRGDVVRSITDQGRFTTWMVSCMTQLMDASGRTYQAFDSTLVGSSQLPYQRHTRHRTGDASTSALQQPDP